MLHYLLQTLAFQLVFLLVYDIFLKKETFFGYNRAYLLLTPLVALLLPLLNIPQLQSIVPDQTMIMLPEIMLTAEPSEAAQGLTENAAVAEHPFNWWYLIYGCGIVLSLLLFLNKFRNMKNLFRLRPTAEAEDFKIVQVPDSKLAFTFFRTIFIGEQLSEQEKEQILNHEKVHVQQWHSLDLLYFEFLRIILWFNPLIYIFQARITELHEFIADSGVVKKIEKQAYYQQLLNSAFDTENFSFINQFSHHSSLKKRIIMLQKSRSNTRSKFKFLILGPVMMIMLIFVACSEEDIYLAPENLQSSQEVELVNNAVEPEYSARELIYYEKNNIVKLVGEVSFKTDIIQFEDAQEVIWDKNRNEIFVSGLREFTIDGGIEASSFPKKNSVRYKLGERIAYME